MKVSLSAFTIGVLIFGSSVFAHTEDFASPAGAASGWFNCYYQNEDGKVFEAWGYSRTQPPTKVKRKAYLECYWSGAESCTFVDCNPRN